MICFGTFPILSPLTPDNSIEDVGRDAIRRGEVGGIPGGANPTERAETQGEDITEKINFP